VKKLLSLLLIFSCASFAAASAGSSNDSLSPSTIKNTPAFLDQYYQQNQAKTHALGIAVSLVQKNQADVVKTYGLANLKTKTPVTGDKTVFRIASVSKVFVAVAVLQQVELGRLNLDTDINQYLKTFKVPATFFGPITLRHLLTHTAGFEDKLHADLTLDKAHLQSLGTHLATNLPTRIAPAGQRISYSNYGSALAGFIVEQVSGLDFADYTKKYVLQPIGMHHSGYRLADIPAGHFATGYQLKDGDFVERPYTWVHRYPPTSMMSTASDMALFMRMLLNGGSVNQHQVLSQNSIDALFSQQFSHDPDLPGMSLGLMQWNRNGQQTYYHDGAHFGFTSQMILNPSKGSGYFIASNQMNSSLPEDLRFDLQEFLYSKEKAVIPKPLESKMALNSYSGVFVNNRFNRSTFEKFASLFDQEVSVSSKNGQLMVLGRQYQAYGEHRFVNVESGHRLVFEVNSQGQVTHLFLDWSGAPRALEKRQWFATSTVQLYFLGILLFAGLMLTVRFCFRYVGKTKLGADTGNKLTIIALSGNLLFGAALLTYFATLDPLLLRAGQMLPLTILLAFPLGAAALFSLSVILSVRSRFGKPSTEKTYWIATAWLVNLGFLIFWWHWNLLGYHFT